MAIEIRTAHGDELRKAFALTRAAGLNRREDEDNWLRLKRWSFLESRRLVGGDPPPGLIAHDDGKAVGFIGFSYRMFRTPGLVTPAVVLCDHAVHPDARGVVGLMMNRATVEAFTSEETRHTILGLHHTEAAGKIWQRFGAGEVAGSDTTFSGLLDTANLATARYPALRPVLRLAQRAGAFGAARRLFAARGYREISVPAQDHGLTITPLQTSGDLAAEAAFLASCSRPGEMGVVRNGAYLQWRYLDHPDQSHRLYIVSRGNQRLGLIALRLSAGMATLCEALYDAAVPAAAVNLVHAAVSTARAAGAAYLRAKPVNRAIAKVMSDLHFEIERKPYNQFWVLPADLIEGEPVYSFGDASGY